MNPFRSTMTPRAERSARGQTGSPPFGRASQTALGSFLKLFVPKALRKWVTLSTAAAGKGSRGGLTLRWCGLAQRGRLWPRGAHQHQQRPPSAPAAEGAVSQLKAKAVLGSFLFPG